MSRVNPGPYPWCLFGDFNEIMMASEKVGGPTRFALQMRSFVLAVEQNNLIDVGYRGNPFTWTNGHSDMGFRNERLDRVFVNKMWQVRCSRLVVDSLVARCSDHNPLFLSMLSRLRDFVRRRKPFMFEASWTKRQHAVW